MSEELTKALAAWKPQVDALPVVPVINDLDSWRAWVEYLKSVKLQHARLEEVLAYFLEPVKEQEKRIRGAIGPLIKALGAFEERCKEQINGYRNRVEEHNAQAAQLLAEAQASGDFQSANAIQVLETPEAEGVSFRTEYDYEVCNFDMIPRPWVCLDTKEINKTIREARKAGKPPVIPGITFRRTSSAAVTRKG